MGEWGGLAAPALHVLAVQKKSRAYATITTTDRNETIACAELASCCLMRTHGLFSPCTLISLACFLFRCCESNLRT